MATSSDATQTINLTVQPPSILVDEVVSISVSGCIPGQKVTLHASSYDTMQERWMSFATFVAGISGEISLDTQKPVAGSYHTVDPRGLFWSMHPVNKKHKVPFMIHTQNPIVIEISVEIDGRFAGSTSIEMRFSAPDVISVPVCEHELIGTFCHPSGPGPYPSVLLLSGSDALLCDNQAALLASHGYATLALPYFGHKGVPPSLANIPLEYFERAIQWLQQQEMVDEKKLAAIGFSRGGELVLLLASRFPAIRAVVAGSPSAYMQAGLLWNNAPTAAWTYHDEPLPYLKPRIDVFSFFALLWHTIRKRAFALRPLFLATLKDYENLAEAAIPVEKIQGPVLLISGQDDQLLPARLFAERAIQRLASYNHPYPYQHLSYQGAGHFVSFPYGYPCLPPIIGTQQRIACGGSVRANATSVSESWQAMLTFLQESLQDSLAHPVPIQGR